MLQVIYLVSRFLFLLLSSIFYNWVFKLKFSQKYPWSAMQNCVVCPCLSSHELRDHIACCSSCTTLLKSCKKVYPVGVLSSSMFSSRATLPRAFLPPPIGDGFYGSGRQAGRHMVRREEVSEEVLGGDEVLIRAHNKILYCCLSIFFLTMYFGLPRYIPPRPLGETRVRKHWSTKYIFQYNILQW
jgi:hypothetical protein